MDLINDLNRLSKIGCVNIHSHDDFTFSCNVNLFVKTKGTEFKIKSDFEHKTLESAVLQLLERVRNAMSSASDLKVITE